MTTLHDFKAANIDGAAIDLASYEDSVVLVVNTASECGFTPQYAGLQQLHEQYADSGFAVLGFPCDQFGHQEPGDEEEIAAFCDRRYHVSFPMFSKIEVKGDGAHPLFAWLQGEHEGLPVREVRWNFNKYLVGRDGRVIKYYGSTAEPASIGPDVEAALAG